MMSSTAPAKISSACCQPMLLIKKLSIGTIKNWPNEPAAAATPIAHERLSAEILRPMMP